MTLLRKPILLRSSKLAKRKRRALYFKATGLLFLIVSIVGVLAYLLSQPKVLIKQIEISGNEVLTEGELRELVEQRLDGRYFFLFPRRSIFLAPFREIERSILETYDRAKKVGTSRTWFQTLHVHVDERQPFALWCREIEVVLSSEQPPESQSGASEATSTSEAVVPESQQLEQCYFLDGEGFIFTEAPRFSGSAYFKYYGDIEENEPVGGQFLTQERFGELRLFLDSFFDTGLGVDALRVTGEGAELVLSEGGVILFTLEQNLTHALDNLESALSVEVFTEGSLDSLEYIDLRFGDKVYYRFKE